MLAGERSLVVSAAAFTSPFVLFDSFFMGVTQLGAGMFLFGLVFVHVVTYNLVLCS
ncbi:hypothetical protein [Enterococcus avium]|uniref:hypothetical protein n=1 Tax=Enterococcus avium TaxID=33945 RepID=UPI001D0E7BAD|nr:hypothetical protein [Enterococcus avium]